MTATLGTRSIGGALSIDVERLVAGLDPALVRFRSKFEIDDHGCWVWKASRYREGYARFSIGGRWVLGHRWLFERVVGRIPDGLDLDHGCRNRACVNPNHLEPVTRRVNLLRGDTIPAANARKTHCPQGHEYNTENTRIYRGGRYCRPCNREHFRRWKERRCAS